MATSDMDEKEVLREISDGGCKYDLLHGEYFADSDDEYYHMSEDDELIEEKNLKFHSSLSSAEVEGSEDENIERKDQKDKDERQICHYYLRNACRFSSEKCWFQHIKDVGSQRGGGSSASAAIEKLDDKRNNREQRLW